jgi:hypothetical protein
MPDSVLATELARALDGHDTSHPEAEELAALLRSAADVARFEVDADETERRLAETRRRAPAARVRTGAGRRFGSFRPRHVVAGTLAAVAIAVAALIALPESNPPGLDVEARALAAISEGPPILQAITQTTAVGRAEKVVRIEWIDPAGDRQHVQVQVGSLVLSETLVEQGRVTLYQPQAGRAVIAPSCSALPGGCAALLDPIAFYRRALEQQDAGEAQEVELDGRRAYLFTLPVQALGGSTNLIEQQVWVDAETFLPVQIVWRETVGGGPPTPVAEIDVVSVKHLGTAEAGDAFALHLPPDTRVVQVATDGAEIGKPLVQPATPAEARSALPAARWLGRSYQGLRLRKITVLRWPSVPGVAVRFDYGPLTLWSFDRVIPAPLLEGSIVPEKLIGDSQGVVRFYVARDGRLVAERDHPGISVAAVGPEFEKLDLFAAVDEARPL